MTAPALSYVHGTSAVPLLGETIGANLRRPAERVPDADALLARASVRPARGARPVRSR